LEYLERANLFIIALDDERQWYRYHHLFAEALRSRPQQAQSTSALDLHHRASLWYEQHEMFAEAVSHALAASDIERTAHLIAQRGMLLAQRGQAHMVLDWLNTLPDTLVRARSHPCIIHALVLMLTHQLDASEIRLRDAERCIQTAMPAEQVQTILGWVAALRGTFAIFSGDLAQNVAYSR
jgi:LuxR family transcriptional regulator, maltose regulon positive regulatory protein